MTEGHGVLLPLKVILLSKVIIHTTLRKVSYILWMRSLQYLLLMALVVMNIVRKLPDTIKVVILVSVCYSLVLTTMDQLHFMYRTAY